MKTGCNGSRRIPKSPWRNLVRASGCEDGNVSIEMAFLVTFLLALILGAYDFGRLAFAQAGVTAAARAGAQYAVLDQANAADLAGMIQAARDEADDVNSELPITARSFCRCPGSNLELSCTGSCADGQYAALYVQITVEDQMELLFHYPGVSEVQSLSSTSTLRVR